jgi:hypothetical protein
MKAFRLVFLKPEFGSPIAQVGISDFTKHDYKGEENTIFHMPTMRYVRGSGTGNRASPQGTGQDQN